VGACAWVPHLDVCVLCAPAPFRTPTLFALLPVLGVRPPCLVFCPPVVVRVRVHLCYDLCHMSPPGLRPRAAASAVPPVAHPAGSPVDPAAARLSGLSPAAAPFSPAPTAFPHGSGTVRSSDLRSSELRPRHSSAHRPASARSSRSGASARRPSAHLPVSSHSSRPAVSARRSSRSSRSCRRRRRRRRNRPFPPQPAGRAA